MMNQDLKRICVYCGSSAGLDQCYAETAQKLGLALVDRKYDLVYGGSDLGLMGEVANMVLRSGGSAIGIIPKGFADRVNQPKLTQLHVVESMHERKTLMFEMSDGFIALPGGLGTLEEVTETLTWAQLGLHKKPCGLLNVKGYYDKLLDFLNYSTSEGFIKPEHRDMLIVESDPEKLLERFSCYTAPKVDKWHGLKGARVIDQA